MAAILMPVISVHISQSKRRFSPDNIQGKDKKRGRTVNVRPLLFFCKHPMKDVCYRRQIHHIFDSNINDQPL